MATTTEFFKVIFGAEDELSGPMASIAAGAAKMLAGFFAVQKLGDFLSSSLTAAIQSEEAWNRLGAAVERHGGAWASARGELEDFALSLQTNTGASDEAIAGSLQMFIDFGATAEQAMQRVRVASDLAAGANIDLESATNLLAKASAGATEMLGRYGIRVDENLSKSEKFAAALDLINQRFGGAALARMDTISGQSERLAQAWDNVKEQLGQAALQGGFLFHAMAGWSDVLEKFNESMRGPDNTSEIGISKQLIEVQAEIEKLHKRQDDDWTAVGKQIIGNRIAELEREREVLGVKLRALQAVGNENDRLNLAERNLQAIGIDGPMTDAAVAAQLYEEGLSRVNRQLDETWQQTVKLMKGQDIFDGFGDTIRDGFSDVTSGPGWNVSEGPMSMIWEHDEESAKQALDKIKDHQAEWQDFALSSTGQITSEIAGMFVGLEGDLKSVFRNIAKDWIALVLNDILKQTALKLGSALFGLLFPAQGQLIAAANLKGIGNAGPMSPIGKVGPASIAVYIQGDIIGEEQYVREKVVPIIERGAEYGLNKLALQGTL